jgi:hypothetical protein
VYPTLSKGINEHIASLTVFDNSSAPAAPLSQLNFAGTKWIDALTVAGQAIAEIFLSAVIGIYLTNLYARHRPAGGMDREFSKACAPLLGPPFPRVQSASRCQSQGNAAPSIFRHWAVSLTGQIGQR